jgi:hypothetical protein
MEAASASEMSVNFHATTRRNIPEDTFRGKQEDLLKNQLHF